MERLCLVVREPDQRSRADRERVVETRSKPALAEQERCSGKSREWKQPGWFCQNGGGRKQRDERSSRARFSVRPEQRSRCRCDRGDGYVRQPGFGELSDADRCEGDAHHKGSHERAGTGRFHERAGGGVARCDEDAAEEEAVEAPEPFVKPEHRPQCSLTGVEERSLELYV